MRANEYHRPVLLREAVDALLEDENGIYVDVTFGGGGHSREVLSRLGDKGRLIAFDRDEDAAHNLLDDRRFSMVQADFRYMKNHLKFLGIQRVDGILADLGVSSHQFDVPERGFSIRSEGKLDMRMGRQTELTAERVVNSYDADELTRIFKNYGELRAARRIAAKVIEARRERSIRTTGDLVKAIEQFFPEPKRRQNLAKLFQAIRIEVNDELGALLELLQQSAEMIKEGGRLVVISYHSLEDRLVKRFMRSGNVEGQVRKDFFGNPIRPFTPRQGMPIIPSAEEIAENARARSAKMRVAVKNEQAEENN
jgi:16S rRNA (cytosine1402-N4)-methyltransferase